MKTNEIEIKMYNSKTLKSNTAQAITEFIITLLPLMISFLFIVQVSIWIITKIQSEIYAYKMALSYAQSEGYDLEGASPSLALLFKVQNPLQTAYEKGFNIYIKTLKGSIPPVQRSLYSTAELSWRVVMDSLLDYYMKNLSPPNLSTEDTLIDARTALVSLSKEVPSFLPFLKPLKISSFHTFIVDPFYPFYPAPALNSFLWPISEFK